MHVLTRKCTLITPICSNISHLTQVSWTGSAFGWNTATFWFFFRFGTYPLGHFIIVEVPFGSIFHQVFTEPEFRVLEALTVVRLDSLPSIHPIWLAECSAVRLNTNVDLQQFTQGDLLIPVAALLRMSDPGFSVLKEHICYSYKFNRSHRLVGSLCFTESWWPIWSQKRFNR